MPMNILKSFQLIGGFIGFLIWFVMLESKSMGNIIFRKNSTGGYSFTPQNISRFLYAPFLYNYFWSFSFLLHNWIIMTSLGIFIGYFLSKAV